MSKGMIYTSFAILSASLLLMIVAMPYSSNVDIDASEASRIDEASFFLDSIYDDMDRTLSMSARRGMNALTNLVIDTGEPIENPEEALASVMEDGEYQGERFNTMEDATLQEWVGRVSQIAEGSGYEIQANLIGIEILGESGMSMDAEYTVETELVDPSTQVHFQRNNTESSLASFEGVEDAMILLRSEGRYVSQYNECSFNSPAELIYTGTSHSESSIHGAAVLNPENIESVENKGEKIIAADNIEDYDQNQVNQFEGAVSASNPTTTGYDTDYVFGTGSIDNVVDNENLLLNNEDVWRSQFEQMIFEDCYVTAEEAPGFKQRLQDNLNGQNGVTTLLDVSELPEELRRTDSAVDYVYFGDTGDYGGLNRIASISDEYSWFRLDDHHVEEWDLNNLVE